MALENEGSTNVHIEVQRLALLLFNEFCLLHLPPHLGAL